MYSWKAIRSVASILLLLPIVHLAYLVSRDTLASLDASPHVWQEEIDAYARIDSQSTLPDEPIVVVGGRRATLWRQLEDALAPHPVLMRGLGDAIVEDITANYSRLVGYYRPEILILVPGTSEFFLRDNKSPEELVAAIQALHQLDTSYGTTNQFYVIGPMKTVSRPKDNARVSEVIRALKDWATERDSVTLIDPNPILSDASGRPKPRYFRSDGLHLNDEGYLRLSFLVSEQVKTDVRLDDTVTASR
ncbi:MAG: GDSL-type esterase/lipase family protein [Pseudomonadota bacterium]